METGKFWRHLAQAAAAIALALCAVACGGSDEDPATDFDIDGMPTDIDPPDLTPTSADLLEGPCVEGTVESCRVPLSAHGDVRNCFVGIQVCVDGAWSACME